VLVVDEAAMVGTRQMAELAESVRRVRGKLVLVGDHAQVPEIEAGGAFRGLYERLSVIELRENRRQVEPWEQQALTLLREDRGRDALDEYAAHGRLRAGAHEQLVADWWSAGAPEQSVMLAYRRADVAELNARARERMVRDGAVSGPELLVNGTAFAAGDRVLLRRNDRRIDVANGDRGLVTAVDVDRGQLCVRVGERDIVLGCRYLDAPGRPTVQHGYAMTGHAAQGLTVDRAFVLATEDCSREWLYMAMSRGRLDNRLYGSPTTIRDRDEIAPSEPARDAGEVLELAVQRSAAQRMAIDRRVRERGQTRDFGRGR
jgi:ATP-dependent exoDNAse (exonuclease V) alpha subunit